MNWKSVLLALGLTLLFSGAIYAQDPIISSINYQRKIRKIPVLVENYTLNLSARYKACDLNKRKYWSHVSPNGTQPWDIMRMMGYKYDWSGENLAKQCTDKNCMYLWMNSKSHRENILFSGFTEIGVGRCGTYKVVHFGSRK